MVSALVKHIWNSKATTLTQDKSLMPPGIQENLFPIPLIVPEIGAFHQAISHLPPEAALIVRQAQQVQALRSRSRRWSGER